MSELGIQSTGFFFLPQPVGGHTWGHTYNTDSSAYSCETRAPPPSNSRQHQIRTRRTQSILYVHGWGSKRESTVCRLAKTVIIRWIGNISDILRARIVCGNLRQTSHV
ncbi:hypothetical protein K504DRAFT_187223 [Pleomassaria siparia CBS 279.74]|uniref:Uncharacterized protein n=1 Tax=Pleomassaria siparia CBS 279.74 TaxID=1314801 RepID=A0A6G1JRB0_9PLEO|nr:hypothetical protein K504DRAFT_187223 [Pleomassaria siparia CBS 279.74]